MFTSSAGNIFDGVSVLGDLDLSGSSSALRLRNGTSVSGTINLTGNNSRLGLEGVQTFDGNILQSTGTSAQVTLEGNADVIIGAASSITGTRLDIGNAFAVGGTRVLTNNGTVTATGSNSTGLVFNTMNSLTNNGTFEAINGGRLQVASGVENFVNLNSGVLTGGTYRVGENSIMNLGGSIQTNAANIELLGPGADLVGFSSLSRNEGDLTIAGEANYLLLGDIEFTVASIFRIAIDGVDTSLIVPLLTANGDSQLGGRLVLEFSTPFVPSDEPQTFRFLNAASFAGDWSVIDIVGLNPAFVSFDAGPGTFTLIPAPASAGLMVLAGLAASRRRRS